MPLSERSQLIGEGARDGLAAKFTQFMNKVSWHHILAAAAFTTLMALFVVALQNKAEDQVLTAKNAPAALKLTLENDLDNNINNELDSSSQNGQVEYTPEGFTFSPVSPSASSGSISGVHLLIQRLELNVSEIAVVLTDSRAKDLVSIDIRTESIVGQYSRIYTPNLRNFRFNVSGAGDDIEQGGNFFYRQPGGLKEILFFELQKTPDFDPTNQNTSHWDTIKDIANLGVVISVSIKGTKLIEINRAQGLLELNVDYGWEILENTRGSYDKLALVSCPWAVVPNDPLALTFPPSLKYLNLFNITNPSKSGPMHFSSFFSGQNQNLGGLETLIVYQYPWGSPTLQTSLNLPDLPIKSLKKITFRGISLTLHPPTYVAPTTDLTLEDNEYSPEILENFATIFQATKILRLFNLQSDSNDLLYKAISSLKSVYRILVVGLDRNTVSPRTNELLTSFGLSPTAESFALIRDYSGYAKGPNANNPPAPTFIANEVSSDDAHHERYRALGFPDLETFEHYFNHL